MSPLSAAAVAAVALGGAAGAAVRWGVIEATGATSVFPWWTLLVNIVGCLLLGLLLGAGEQLRLPLGVGFCGGLTTMSTFSVEAARLVDTAHVDIAAAYVASSLAGGVAAVVCGFRLAPAAR